MRGAFLEAELAGDPTDTLAGGPTHDGREGMHASAAAQFPEPGVRLVVAAPGLFAEQFEAPEQRFVAAPGQTPVEKDMGRRQDRRAIDIMLDLAIGLIADTDRPHSR